MVLKIFRVVALLLIIALLGVVSVNLFIYREDNEHSAIILINGICGGGLVDADYNPVWDPYGGELYYKNFFEDPIAMVVEILFGAKYSETTSKLFDSILNNKPDNLIYQLTSDEDGKIKNNGIKAARENSALPYGPMNAYKDMFNGLYNEFNKDIDVVMFQYDWREDNRISAQHLEDFINQKGYGDVIICAHSLGNVVTANYLAKSKENRDKIRGYMAMAGPFWGSTNALTVMEDPGVYIDGVTDMINNNAVLKSLFGNKLNTVINDQILPFIYNMASVAQLLPTIEYAKALKEYYGEIFLTVDGREITTNAELVEFYKSRPWAKKSNNQYRAFIQDLDVFMDSMYVEVDGERFHSSELVNTHYFAGTGRNTAIGLKINGDIPQIINAPLGDGTVPIYSAIIGKDPSTNSNIKIYEMGSHFDMGMYFGGQFAQDLSTAIRYLL